MTAFLIFLLQKEEERKSRNRPGCESLSDLVSVVKWDRDKSMLARFTDAGAPQRARNRSELLRLLWGEGGSSRSRTRC